MHQFRIYFEGRASRIGGESDIEYERGIMMRLSFWVKAEWWGHLPRWEEVVEDQVLVESGGNQEVYFRQVNLETSIRRSIGEIEALAAQGRSCS